MANGVGERAKNSIVLPIRLLVYLIGYIAWAVFQICVNVIW